MAEEATRVPVQSTLKLTHNHHSSPQNAYNSVSYHNRSGVPFTEETSAVLTQPSSSRAQTAPRHPVPLPNIYIPSMQSHDHAGISVHDGASWSSSGHTPTTAQHSVPIVYSTTVPSHDRASISFNGGPSPSAHTPTTTHHRPLSIPGVYTPTGLSHDRVGIPYNEEATRTFPSHSPTTHHQSGAFHQVLPRPQQYSNSKQPIPIDPPYGGPRLSYPSERSPTSVGNAPGSSPSSSYAPWNHAGGQPYFPPSLPPMQIQTPTSHQAYYTSGSPSRDSTWSSSTYDDSKERYNHSQPSPQGLLYQSAEQIPTHAQIQPVAQSGHIPYSQQAGQAQPPSIPAQPLRDPSWQAHNTHYYSNQ